MVKHAHLLSVSFWCAHEWKAIIFFCIHRELIGFSFCAWDPSCRCIYASVELHCIVNGARYIQDRFGGTPTRQAGKCINPQYPCPSLSPPCRVQKVTPRTRRNDDILMQHRRHPILTRDSQGTTRERKTNNLPNFPWPRQFFWFYLYPQSPTFYFRCVYSWLSSIIKVFGEI